MYNIYQRKLNFRQIYVLYSRVTSIFLDFFIFLYEFKVYLPFFVSSKYSIFHFAKLANVHYAFLVKDLLIAHHLRGI